MLPTVEHHCSAASVNRKLASLTSFCGFHARHGVELTGLLVIMQPAGRRGGSATAYKPFLHHVTKSRPERRRTIKLNTPRMRPKVLTPQQVQAILDACEHLRDRLLFALLLDTGVRIGEALGLRHEDLAIAERRSPSGRGDNDNRARAKTGVCRTIPASPELMRLYADYLNGEYGALDSDYVFVNLWSEPKGRPWAYPAVYDLVRRLRARTGIDFGPHHYRHTYATWLLRRGAGMESVKELLGHASITTTIDTYGHLTVEDARRPWKPRAGSPGGRCGCERPRDAGGQRPSGSAGKLMAVVRPEFRVEVLCSGARGPGAGCPGSALCPAATIRFPIMGSATGIACVGAPAAGRRGHSSWPIRDRRCGAGRVEPLHRRRTAATALPDQGLCTQHRRSMGTRRPARSRRMGGSAAPVAEHCRAGRVPAAVLRPVDREFRNSVCASHIEARWRQLCCPGSGRVRRRLRASSARPSHRLSRAWRPQLKLELQYARAVPRRRRHAPASHRRAVTIAVRLRATPPM